MNENDTTEQSLNMTRRGFVAAAAATAATCAVASSALADAAAPSFTAGTYTGTGEGVGTVTATVTFDETGMTEVALDVSGETPFVGGQIGETFAGTILEAKSTDVDIIAGCTMTCDGAIAAVNACIAQATGAEIAEPVKWDDQSAENWLGTEPVIDEAQITESWDTDILIVGAGNAGCAAGAYAAQNGLNFRLIETAGVVQDTRHWYGTIDSSAAQEAGCEPVDRRKLLSEISRYASGKCDQRVVRMWINESAALHDFVAGIATAEPYNYEFKFTSGEAAHWPDDCAEENTVYFFPEQEVACMGWEKSRNVVFQEYIESQGYAIDFNTALVKLEREEGGRVTGVIAQSKADGHFIRINAAAGVLLACGGYDGNPMMMDALDPLSASVTTCYNYSPRDRGMGIRAGIWAGAALQAEPASMLFDRGLVAPGVDAGYHENPAAFGGKEFPGTLKQFFPGTQPFLKVNRRGERFFNESTTYDNASYASSNQPGHVYCQIIDANADTDVDIFHTVGCSAGVQNGRMISSVEQQVEAGLVQKADTIEELADKLGFVGADKDTFLATVERYNEIVDAGYDEDFGKPAVRLSALRTAPFYGSWLGASLLCTMQGVNINENAQVVDTQAAPIEGLYAAGNNAGSFFANNYPCVLPGTRCGSAMVQGIKAVKQMGGLE